MEKLRNRNFFYYKSVKNGDFVTCIDDEGDKSYDVLVPTTKKEKEFYGSFVNCLTGQKVIPREYKWEKSRKLKTLTFNRLYEVLNIRETTGNKKKSEFRIIGDNKCPIWITTDRFEFNPEKDINERRFIKLKDILR